VRKLSFFGRALIWLALGLVLLSHAAPPVAVSPISPAPPTEPINNLERGLAAPMEQRAAVPKPAMDNLPRSQAVVIARGQVGVASGKERRTVRIGVEYNSPPLSYVSIPDQPEGFTVELLREIGFVAQIDFVYVQGSWTFILAEFKAGRIDALANTLINQDRLKFMDFSIGHTALHSIIFTRPEDSPMTRTAQFVGKKMAALRGTQAYFGAMANRGWGAQIVPFDSYPEMLAAVKNGDCDFALSMRLLRTEFILARPSNLPPQYVSKRDGEALRVEYQPDELGLRRDFMDDIVSQFHIAVHKGDAENLAVINEGLATVRANGTFDRLYAKWIGPIQPRKIQLKDLRPYLGPIGLGALLILGIIIWQQAHTRALGRHASALRKSEGDLRRTNMLGRIGGWELDLKTKQYTWSEEIFHINELDPAGPVPTADSGLFDGYTEANRALVSAAIGRCIADGLAFDLEVEKTTAAGRPIWVRIQGAAESAGSVIVKLVGILQDITARKQSESLLRLKNAALEASAEGIVITDRQGLIVWVNPAFTSNTGYALDEVVGQNSRFLKSGQHDQAFYKTMWATLLQGQTWHGEIYNRGKDGRIILERQIMSPLCNKRGEITHFIDVRWDITEERKVQQQLQSLETQNQQLQKAESLSRMAGAIAHHFNNQLQGVMGNLELMKTGRPSESAKGYVAAAEVHAQKAAEMSSLMLTYLGESPQHQEPLALAAVATQSLHLLSAATPAGVVLKADLASPSPVILGNGKQLYQIFSALLTNAWEASPRPCVVHVGLQLVLAENIETKHRMPVSWQPTGSTYACLQVIDSGSGIAPDALGKIYDPFYSTHAVGRGLGLSAALGLVRAHQGVITVDSVLGAGTTFRVYFPLSDLPVPAATERQLPALPLPTAPRGRTVLVVEDDASLRSTVRLALEIEDFTVLEAADGVEALALFAEHQAAIGCVLCDVIMPRMNGWETLSALRKFTADLPIIIASGYSETHLAAEAGPQPPHLFMQKPYALAELTKVLRSTLG